MLVGMVLCVAWPTVAGLCIGTVLIGAMTMPLVVLVMREARLLAPANPTRLIAVLTTMIGTGQMIGPPVAAWLAQRSHGFSTPMLAAAGAAGLAMVVMLWRRVHVVPADAPRAALPDRRNRHRPHAGRGCGRTPARGRLRPAA